MCGIVGIISPGTPKEQIHQNIRQLKAQIYHRGPDEDGVYCLNDLGLGIQRLSILDLENGAQPVISEDGQVVVIHNGEIYNLLELRNELKREGYKFQTRCDTEVILKGYCAWGLDVLDRLNGIFAFAILDLKKRRIFLVRDHLGVKPLYYYDDKIFAFCSEPAALWQHPQISRKLNHDSLTEFLAFKYVPSPFGFTDRLKKLKPAHYLEVALDGEVIQERCYWTLRSTENSALNQEDVNERLESLVLQSVHRQLISDVPIGVLLSGGIDSSLLLWAAAQSSRGHKLTTYTVGFEERSFDESDTAAFTAHQLGIPQYSEKLPTPSPADLDDCVRKYGEPFANTSIPGNFFLYSQAAKHVKVALNGTGADELFAGYERYYSVKPPFLLKAASLFAPILSPYLNRLEVGDSKSNFVAKAQRYITLSQAKYEHRHSIAVQLLNNKELEELLIVNKPYPSTVRDLFGNAPQKDGLHKSLWTDLHSMLPEDYLSLVDRTSMSNSLEVRVPFLDRDVVEFAFSVPSSLKLSGWQKKIPLKAIARNRLPKGLPQMSKKGFEVPVGNWFRGPLSSALKERLNDRRLRDLLNGDALDRLYNDHYEFRHDRSKVLLGLYSLSVWIDKFDIQQ
jgi:asparagine synthase (glutamine-hydrolysing)